MISWAKQGWEYRLTRISWCNYPIIFKISLKYRYRIFFENITRYFIMYYWSILAFHGPVKAEWLFKFLMVWHISAWIGVFYAFVVHLKNDFLCIVRSFHEFHENVVIFATYAHILPNEKYRVIIVSKPKISCNIVWTLKKDIAKGCFTWIK